jgi:hypothetical protein
MVRKWKSLPRVAHIQEEMQPGGDEDVEQTEGSLTGKGKQP